MPNAASSAVSYTHLDVYKRQQLVTPDEMRGRVSSINGIFVSSSNELGAFYDGVMARLFTLVPAITVGGCVTWGAGGITAKLSTRHCTLDICTFQ